jgi:hypothetical protein
MLQRISALFIFLVGLAMAAGYLFVASAPSLPVGKWPVYTRAGGFAPVEARLHPEDAPVEVYVDLATSGSPNFGKDRAVLTLTAATNGKTAIAAPLSFADAVSRDDTPQTPELIYRTKAGEIASLAADAPVTFTVGPGDADEIDISAVDLVLQHGRATTDEGLVPIGYAVMAIGAIAFLLSFRKTDSGPPPNPNSQPPPPRWGRTAGERK